VEKVWADTYKDLNGIATPISDAIMERYGVSSTPTFVFIDRNGKVRRYLPSRLTDEELSKNIDRILAR
jgi:thioredoxin-related protein